MTLEQLALFLPAALLVAAGPGANNLLSLSHGAQAGFRPTAVSLLGRFTAFALLLGLVALGLGALLAASETAFWIIKWLGVAYLAYLGLRLLLAPGGPPEPAARTGDSAAAAAPGRPAWRLARKEFLVAATNPKAVLLFTAFVPQFIHPGESYGLQLLALGALYIAVEAGAACGYAAAGALLRSARLSTARQRLVNRLFGGLLLGAAATLAGSRSPA
ncbi:hypothetical protein AY600_14190 [Phormidium willei BDU 130791]|nr:hypothetical protein AY600_14190 [Phormidium willei BDU 130791]